LQYRTLKDGTKVSLLGMGIMRMPTEPTEDGGERPIQSLTDEMVKLAVEGGINYFDSAYVYNSGNNERAMGKALAPYRDQVMVATKLAMGYVHEYKDFMRQLDEQLDRLQMDYIDYYLMHNLGTKRLNTMLELGILKFLDEAKAQGKIRHAGFSCHNGFEGYKKTLDCYDWELTLVQYNILDKHTQVGLKGLDYAYSKNVPVAIMEGLRGGDLVNPPQEALDRYHKADASRSIPQWGFRFVADHPAVKCILSGMTSVEQLKDNLSIFDSLPPAGSMTAEESALYDDIRAIYTKRMRNTCTRCNYCQPCPKDVYIPGIFTSYNRSSMFDAFESAKADYTGILKKGRGSDQCVRCGLCETKCPQGVSIMEDLQKAHEYFTK